MLNYEERLIPEQGERPGVSLDPFLQPERGAGENVHAVVGRIIEHHAACRDPTHLTQKLFPVLHVRQQPDAQDNVERAVSEWKREQVRPLPGHLTVRDERLEKRPGRGAAPRDDRVEPQPRVQRNQLNSR